MLIQTAVLFEKREWTHTHTHTHALSTDAASFFSSFEWQPFSKAKRQWKINTRRRQTAYALALYKQSVPHTNQTSTVSAHTHTRKRTKTGGTPFTRILHYLNRQHLIHFNSNVCLPSWDIKHFDCCGGFGFCQVCEAKCWFRKFYCRFVCYLINLGAQHSSAGSSAHTSSLDCVWNWNDIATNENSTSALQNEQNFPSTRRNSISGTVSV